MTEQEKQLFLTLCRFQDDTKNELTQLLSKQITPTVLGQLFFNRMQSVAYSVLYTTGLLSHVNREFRNSLQAGYEYSVNKNDSYFCCTQLLSSILADAKHPYAMLKGAVLCKKYPKGFRTANDIDLLVSPHDVTFFGDVLKHAGFQQGYLRNQQFVPATRQDIITSKMMRGETVPYILKVDLPFLPYLEVDINFSWDYQNSSPALVDDMLCHTKQWDLGGYSVQSLDTCDFIIHLCGHLYKEATTYSWIAMQRDMTLYKYLDVYLLTRALSEHDVFELYARAKTIGMDTVCSCVFLWTNCLLPLGNTVLIEAAEKILAGKKELLDWVIYPSEHKEYYYTQSDIRTRFFSDNRLSLLKEIL